MDRLTDYRRSAWPNRLPRRSRISNFLSRKLLEELPDHLRAVDVAVLWAEPHVDDAPEARVREVAGHAVAAMVDAVEHSVAPRRTARGDPRHRGRVRFV